MTEVTEYATTFGLLQWDADLSDIKVHDDPQPPKGEGWTLVTACLGALGPTAGPGKQLLVWTWKREAGLSAESVAKTVGVPVPGKAACDCGGPDPIGMQHAEDCAAFAWSMPAPVPVMCTECGEIGGGHRIVNVLGGGRKSCGKASPAPASPDPRWALSTESPEDSWGGNQVRRILRDGKWAATAPNDVASEIVAAMNARDEIMTLHLRAVDTVIRDAAVEALRERGRYYAKGDSTDTIAYDATCKQIGQELLDSADRIERGEKP